MLVCTTTHKIIPSPYSILRLSPKIWNPKCETTMQHNRSDYYEHGEIEVNS